MNDFAAALAAVWPWLTAVAATVVLTTMLEAKPTGDDRLDEARGCLFAVVFMALLVATIVGFIRWLT